MYATVAGHTFELVADGGADLRILLPNFRPFETVKGDALFRVRLDTAVQMPLEHFSVEHVYTLSDGERVTMRIYSSGRRSFTIAVGDALYAMVGIDDGGRWDFKCDAVLRGAGRYIIDHFLVQAFSLATLPFQTLLIHASTIVYDNSAVLFLAESGTGKSTHTRLWCENIEGARLLNDDAPAVRIVDGRPRAFGTPWSGKLPCWRSENHLVKALVRIRRAEFNRLTPLAGLQAITALLPSSLPTLQRTDDDLDGIFTILSALISTTPIYTLECLPNPDAAIVARTAVYS